MLSDDDWAAEPAVRRKRTRESDGNPAHKRTVLSEVISISDDEDEGRGLPELPSHFAELAAALNLDLRGDAGDPRPPRDRRPRRPFVNSASLSFEAFTLHSERHQVALDLCYPKTLAEVDADPRYRGNRSHGDEVLKRMQAALESFQMTRTFLQVRMHDLAMNVMGSAIYGEEWNQHRQRILESNNWRDYPPLMAAICARRFGKSTGAGQLAAASMLSIPNCAVGCFAPTLRQATAIMETTWTLLCRSTFFSEFRIKRTSATRIEIIGPDGTERSLIAYPSTHKVTRSGVGIGARRCHHCQVSRSMFHRIQQLCRSCRL